MILFINGKEVEIPVTCKNIKDLLFYLGVEKKIVMIEHNLKILDRSDHDTTNLADRDRIEIVQFIGGG